MTRSVWKGPYSEIRPSFISSTDERELKKKVWSRRSMILPTYMGKKVLVHNGRIFIRLNISKDMIGHKFGEFALTRKKPRHKINKKKQVARRNKK